MRVFKQGKGRAKERKDAGELARNGADLQRTGRRKKPVKGPINTLHLCFAEAKLLSGQGLWEGTRAADRS